MADNVELVRGGYEAFARGDVAAVLEVLDENVEWNEAEHIPYWPGGPLIGRQAVLEGVFARIAQDFDNFRVDVQRVVDCGETVLVEARYRARVKKTGRPLDAQVAHIWDFRDGKAVRWQQYSDTWQFAELMDFAPTLAPSA
ncbi:MAG: nuclear transport factor 2 family protein [Chloroflexota bacterium]|nr:nuclear transport factor 2 family protein [Chloroflexota bacterium]